MDGGDDGGGEEDDEDNEVEPRSTRGRAANEWPRPAADAKAEVQEGMVAEVQAVPAETEAKGGAAVEAVTAPAADEGEDEAAPAYVAALAFLEEHAPPVEPRPVRPTIGLRHRQPHVLSLTPHTGGCDCALLTESVPATAAFRHRRSRHRRVPRAYRRVGPQQSPPQPLPPAFRQLLTPGCRQQKLRDKQLVKRFLELNEEAIELGPQACRRF